MYNYNQPNDGGSTERPAPEFQDNYQAQPWFVSEENNKPSVNEQSKKIVKRTTSVLFPILGLTAIISTLGIVLYFVMGLYQ